MDRCTWPRAWSSSPSAAATSASCTRPGGGACSWYELAVEVFDRAGVRCRVLPTTSDRFPRPARRPAYSVLGTERDEAPVLPPWQDGVAAYLSERAVVAR